MNISYSEPCDAVTLRIFELIFTPPVTSTSHTATTTTLTTDDEHEDQLFKLLRLHLTTVNHLNYIESTTGLTYLMAIFSTLHFNLPKRLSLCYYLLNRQCDPNIANIYTKKTALHYLLENLHMVTIPVIQLIYHLLTSYSADINGFDSQGRIPITFLASNVYLPITPLFIALQQLLFTHNSSTYPLDYEPLSISLSYYVFANPRYMKEIQFPTNAYDFMSETSQIQLLLLPQYDSIIAPILHNHDDIIIIDRNHQYCDVNLDEDNTHKQLLIPPHVPPLFTTFLAQFEQLEASVINNLHNEEWKYYKYYVFDFLHKQRQNVHSACAIESIDCPQFYSIEYSNPLYQEICFTTIQPRNTTHLIIQPAPIHQLFTMIPKLDVSAIRAHQLQVPSTDFIPNGFPPNSEHPISTSSLLTTTSFASQLIPPLSMLRCLFLQDPYLFADVHNHIILFLQSHPYITPQHIELIKFLFILRKDYNHELAISHILEILTITFKHTFTIPPAQLLKFSQHYFNPIPAPTTDDSAQSTQLTTTMVSPDYYGIIPSYESDWSSTMIEKRTAPYLDLLAFCFALFEHAFYRDICPLRNPTHANSPVPKFTENTVNLIIDHLLFVSCTESTQLHPKQIIPIHQFLLYYTPLSNSYCNIPLVIDTFNNHLVQIEKISTTSHQPLTSNQIAITIPDSLTTFIPHVLQIQVLQSTEPTCGSVFNSYTLFDAIFKPLNGTQASGPFHIVSHLGSNFTIPPRINELADKSILLYKSKKDPNQAFPKTTNETVSLKQQLQLNKALHQNFIKEKKALVHLSNEDRAKYAPLPSILDGRTNNFYQHASFEPSVEIQFSLHPQTALLDDGASILGKNIDSQQVLNEKAFHISKKPLNLLHFGYSEALLSKIAISRDHLTARVNINQKLSNYYRTELLFELQKVSPTSFVDFVPVHSSSFPILTIPNVNDGCVVFSSLFDIPLVFSPTTPTKVAATYPQRDPRCRYHYHDLTGSGSLSIISLITLFNKHNRDYSQFIDFMNIHAEFFDLTIQARFYINAMERLRDEYFLQEKNGLLKKAEDLTARIQASSLAEETKDHLVNSFPSPLASRANSHNEFPVNFYSVLDLNLSLEFWCARPLYTTFKYLFENTKIISNWKRLSNQIQYNNSFYLNLLSRCHFHKVTDYDCEQLWDYLRFELNLNPVLTTPPLAKHYLSHSLSKLKNDNEYSYFHNSIFALINGLFLTWNAKYSFQIKTNLFHGDECEKEYNIKVLEYTNNPDQLVDWVVRQYKLAPLDHFSDQDEKDIIAQSSQFSPKTIQIIKNWVIFFRKATCFLSPYSFDPDAKTFQNQFTKSVSLVLQLSEEYSIQLQQKYYTFSKVLLDNCFDLYATPILNNHTAQFSLSTPQTYNEYNTLYPTPDVYHAYNIIHRCQEIDSDWQNSIEAYSLEDNFFTALLQFIQEALLIPVYPYYPSSVQPEPTTLSGFPSCARTDAESSVGVHPPANRFAILLFQDIFQTYFNLPEQLFNEIKLPQVDDIDLADFQISSIATMTFPSLASQIHSAIGSTVYPLSCDVTLNSTIPAVQPLKYYNYKSQEMIFQHPASFPHVNSNIPQAFHNALQFNPESLRLLTSNAEFEMVCQQIMTNQNISIHPLFVTHQYPHFESYSYYIELQRYSTPDQTLAQSNRVSTIPDCHSHTTQVYISSTAVPVGSGYQQIVDAFPAVFFHQVVPMLSSTPSERLKTWYENIYSSYIVINAGSFLPLVQAMWGSIIYTILSTYVPGGLPLVNTKCTSTLCESMQFIQYCNSPTSNIYTRCQHCIESNEIIFNSILSHTKRTNAYHISELFNTLFEHFTPLFSSATHGFLPLVRSRGINQEFKPIDSSERTDIAHHMMRWRPITKEPKDTSASSIPLHFWLYPFHNYNDIGSSFEYNTILSSPRSKELTSYELATSYFFSTFCEYDQHDEAVTLQTLQFPTLFEQIASISEAKQKLGTDFFIRLPYNKLPNEAIQSKSNHIMNFLNGILSAIQNQRKVNPSTHAFHQVFDSLNLQTSRIASFSFNSPHSLVTKSLFNLTALDQKEIDEFKFPAFRIYSNHIPTRTPTQQISFKLLNLIQQLSPLLTTQDHLSLSRALLTTIGLFFHSNRGSKPSPIPITYSIQNFTRINPTIASYIGQFNPTHCSLKEINQLLCPSYSEPIDGYTDIDTFALSCGLLPGLLPPMCSSNALSQDFFGQIQSSIFQQQFLASQAVHQSTPPFQSDSYAMVNDTSNNDTHNSTFTTLKQFMARISTSLVLVLPIQTAFKQTRFFFIAQHYLKYIFESNAFTVLDSAHFASLFTNIIPPRKKHEIQPPVKLGSVSKFFQSFDTLAQFSLFGNRKHSQLLPIDPVFIDFYKSFFLNYYTSVVRNSTPTKATSTDNSSSVDVTFSASATAPFSESPLSLMSIFEVNNPPLSPSPLPPYSVDLNLSRDLVPPTSPQSPSLSSSQRSSASIGNNGNAQSYHSQFYKRPEKIAQGLLQSAKDELLLVDQAATVLLTQIAHTLFSHQFPPHHFFTDAAIRAAKHFLEQENQTKQWYGEEYPEQDYFYWSTRQDMKDNFEFYELNTTLPIPIPQRPVEMINLFRVVMISFLDSPTPSPQQIEFLQWVIKFGHSVLPYKLKQISILFPPNADNICTSNAFALGEDQYPTTFSMSVLFKTTFPSFYQTKLFSSLVYAPNTPLQRTTLLRNSGELFSQKTPTYSYHQDIMGWLIRTYRQNNPFWLSQLIDLLTHGGTFTSPVPCLLQGTSFDEFKKELYQTFDRSDSSGSIMNMLPISPSQKQSPVECYIWQLIQRYHLINLQPINQFSTPVDALLNHPVVEIALFWKNVYQFALKSVYNVSFSTSDLSHTESNLEFNRSYPKYPKLSFPQLLDQLDQLIQLYNAKSDELVRLVDATRDITVDSDGNITNVSCTANAAGFEHHHAELFSFLAEYRYYIDVILPCLDVYPNFSSTSDRKIFCTCKTDALTSLYCNDPTIERVYETCPFCIYKTAIRFQTSLIQFGHASDTPSQYDTFNYFVDDSMLPASTSDEQSTRHLNTKRHQRSEQYIVDFISDILHPADYTSPFFHRYQTISFPALAPHPHHERKPRSIETIAQELKQLLTVVDHPNDDGDASNAPSQSIVIDHSPPAHHHDPIHLSFHLSSTRTRPSVTSFIPTFTQGMLWHLLTTTHLNTDDIVALLSSRHLVLYNTSTNVNHLNHTPLHYAVLLRASPFTLHALWSAITSPHSHSTTQYHDVRYDILFSRDVFNWTLLDYMQLTQSWNFAPEWTHMALQAYQQYDSSITLSKYRTAAQ